MWLLWLGLYTVGTGRQPCSLNCASSMARLLLLRSQKASDSVTLCFWTSLTKQKVTHFFTCYHALLEMLVFTLFHFIGFSR